MFNDRISHPSVSFLVISVPSSSGTRVQRRGRCEAYYAYAIFQSPLHRGLVFNQGKVTVNGPAIANFSPLFIGDSCSTCAAIPTLVRSKDFSPLFIGDSCSTSSDSEGRSGFSKISVPSSSGTRVQHCTSAANLESTKHFSPLFIGDSCSTWKFTGITRAGCDFSPLFIGDSCSTWKFTGITRAGCDFSPLFIGDSCSTKARWESGSTSEPISVPSSSGTRVQP